MADTMQFDLVSPERRLASMQVTAVQIPGADGDMTAMPDHAPTLTTLRPGVLRVEGPEGATEYVVTGGFAEISAAGVSVLAERAVPKGEMTQEHLDEMMEEAKTMYSTAKSNFVNEPGPVDDAAKLLSDMVAMGDQIGLSSKQPSL
ncbi:F0F1 ATP synthase subunit epsilon [Roseobacter sp. GAI101]|uniref:F0F1 ATP synthase subunit epsilon n=1 Tax=Roseobacter sp. (strain GAI101) TaxID=391589 RepID=UPI000187225E|nr:F0F1 ATP synthase subunit epsilon [Roseobacter sp. GAI101]EEB83363.1 ATP synthase F1, epsilon subunit [Roseobacter sp. GAI101]